MDILLCLYSVQSDSGCPARALCRRISFPSSLGSTHASSCLAPCPGGDSGQERQGKVLCSYFGKNLGLFSRLCPCLGIRSVAKVAGNEQEAWWAAQMLCQGIPVPGAARVAAGFAAGRCETRKMLAKRVHKSCSPPCPRPDSWVEVTQLFNLGSFMEQNP